MKRKDNPVLHLIMQEIYRKRNPLPKKPRTVVRFEKVQDRVFCEMWFMTPGCSHDQNGGCTMCNYGKGHDIAWEEILQEIEVQLRKLPQNLQELIVTPTGSMLDEQEVPHELFIGILKLLEPITANEFLVETRADTVTAGKLESIRQYIHAKRIYIEIGVEACNDWILRNCVNKGMDMEELKQALEMIHSKNMYACANIGIGIPFLSERMSIKVAVDSVITAFDMGFDSVVLFPYHIKPGTLIQLLWEMGDYQCCSLWALIEVLGMLPAEMLDKIHISWYRNYYDDKKKVLLSPDTCDACREDVLRFLDEYKNHPGENSRKGLQSLCCGCKNIWKQKILSQPAHVDMVKIAAIYRQLGQRFGIHADIVEQEIAHMESELGRNEDV